MLLGLFFAEVFVVLSSGFGSSILLNSVTVLLITCFGFSFL